MGVRGYRVMALLAAAVLTGTCGWIVWYVLSSPDPAVSDLVQGVLAPVAIAVPALGLLGEGWRRGRHPSIVAMTDPRLDAAADELARRSGESARKTVRENGLEIAGQDEWRWAGPDLTISPREAAVAPPPGFGPAALPRPQHQSPAGLPGFGLVMNLHDELYARLPHGRLVLLAAPTPTPNAALLLQLAALEHRTRVHLGHRDQGRLVPVPVRLDLSDWDRATPRLTSWVQTAIARAHPTLRSAGVGPDTVAALLRTNRIALFLDGFDQLPETVRGQALTWLDAGSDQLRVVLTCTLDAYRAAITHGGWHHAAVIEIRRAAGH